MMDGTLQTHDMNDNLEEVKRNRAVLNIKIRSVFINELEEEERIWKSSKLAGCPLIFIIRIRFPPGTSLATVRGK